MGKYKARKLKYCGGTKTMVSMRFPKRLMAELKVLSESQNKDVTMIVMEAMDEYIEWMASQPLSKKK